MTSRRADLVDRCLAYVSLHGIADLSLRPLAKAVGTSARLLIYHFASREGLIHAVLDEQRARLQAALGKAAASVRPSRDPLLAFWTICTRTQTRNALALLLEVQVLALRDPGTYGRYLDEASESWLAVVQRALPPAMQRPEIATLCIAAVDGLLLELLSTGDRRRTTGAMRVFSAWLHAAAVRPAVRPPRPARARRTARRP